MVQQRKKNCLRAGGYIDRPSIRSFIDEVEKSEAHSSQIISYGYRKFLHRAYDKESIKESCNHTQLFTECNDADNMFMTSVFVAVMQTQTSAVRPQKLAQCIFCM